MTFTTINTPELRLKHLASMSASLAHRLEIARAKHDENLTALLEREYQQLMADCQSTSRPSWAESVNNWLQRQWENLADTMPNFYQLQIQEEIAEGGRKSWKVHYPKTGQTLQTESETEMQTWIKEMYWNA
ncbi:MAG: hypothetical protein IGS48_07395 [Oscillatoriales cyanobacterium C42_A2020_001]|nr:hypothetical protein [Leptolyngbyaceae cyanobacterium C42_A2020_001]